MVRPLLSVALAAAATACAGDAPPALAVDVEVLASPAGPGSGEPFLSTDGDEVHLSWLQAVADGHHELRFSTFDGTAWREPRTIARSAHFFVNWADFPSLTPGPDGTLWAHWLERGPAGGYDYGVRVVRSGDGGETWSDPWTPHDDDSPTEHGFVSTVPAADGIGFVWLDGRRYAAGVDGAPPSEEMTIRYRFVGTGGDPGPEMLVDGRVCDCCQTASAMTDLGPVTVYRDRSDHEIRDIYVTRMVDGAWTEGAAVHDDGWQIAGCPVNGPAVAARGMDVAVAWFTAAGDVPRVKVAFSADGGASFGSSTVVDDGNPVGRVDLLMTDDGSVLVAWLERTGGENAEVRLKRVGQDGNATASAMLVGSSAGRASGFPRLAPLGAAGVMVAWTDLEREDPRVRVARVELGPY